MKKSLNRTTSTACSHQGCSATTTGRFFGTTQTIQILNWASNQGELAEHLRGQELQFAPAISGQEAAYQALYRALVAYRAGLTPGYKLTFEVVEGQHAGRRFWLDLWLTEPSLPMTKRDLLKLGVTHPDQLDQPLPKYLRARVKLALRADDNGREYNRVRSFEVIGVDTPEVDSFAPADPEAAAEGVGGSQAA
jgi:hypothetical protein